MGLRDRLRRIVRSRPAAALAVVAVVVAQVVVPMVDERRQAERAATITRETEALGRMNFETTEILRALSYEEQRDPRNGGHPLAEFDAARERGMTAATRIDVLRAAYEEHGHPDARAEAAVERIAGHVGDAYGAQARRIAAYGGSELAGSFDDASMDLVAAAEAARGDASELGEWIVTRMPR